MSTSSWQRAGWAALAVAAVLALAVVGLVHGGVTVVRADAALPGTPDTVAVTGAGDAVGAPDTLNADFRVHVTRATVQEAIDAQAAAAQRVLSALTKAGVPRSHIRTTDLSIDQHYDEHGNITGYDSSETISARITPLRVAGRTIDAAATASGNDVAVDGLSFAISDDDPLVARARTAAYADAKSRAMQYAGLAGRSLGRVMTIREHIDRPAPTPYPYLDALHSAAAFSKAIPIRGGRQTLSVHVDVVWLLT